MAEFPITVNGETYLVEAPDQITARQMLSRQGIVEQPQRGFIDKLTGVGGDRYQTWPERMVRGVGSSLADYATLPGDVYSGRQQMDDPNITARAVNAAAWMTPVNPAVRSGERAIAGQQGDWMGRSKPVVPGTQELHSTGVADIQAAQNSGLALRPQAASDLASRVQRDLFSKNNIHPVQAPETYAILNDVTRIPDAGPGGQASFTASNLQSLREMLQNTAQNFTGGKDQVAASVAIKNLDDLLPSVAPQDVLAGSPATTAGLFSRGRGNAAAGFRSARLTEGLGRAKTGLLERAEGRAAVANSGRNVGNTIRSKLESLLEQPKQISGFSDAEIAAMDAAARGSRAENLLRGASNTLGGGGGMGRVVSSASGGGIGTGIGALLGGPPGAVVGGGIGIGGTALTGAALKGLANRLARKNVLAIDRMTRMRSPLYEERLAAALASPRQLSNPSIPFAMEKALGARLVSPPNTFSPSGYGKNWL